MQDKNNSSSHDKQASSDSVDFGFKRVNREEKSHLVKGIFSNVAKKYDYAFKSIINIHNGTNGWYSNNVSITSLS